jgi:hypothetical protein
MIENPHCKNCGYLWFEHPTGTIDNETFVYVRIMARNDNPTDCVCLLFYPMKDNLEYLEWEDEHGR